MFNKGIIMQLSDNTVKSRGQTGFQSPCNDYLENAIDLNELFVKDKACTFFARAENDSMIGDGILPGSILLVDKSVVPYNGCIALCWYDGEFYVRRLKFGVGEVRLLCSNPKYKIKVFEEGEELIIWGVVRSVHKKVG